jgi:hypothetical protein
MPFNGIEEKFQAGVCFQSKKIKESPAAPGFQDCLLH